MKVLFVSIPLVAILVPMAANAEELVSKAPDKRVTVAATGVVAMPQADADDTTETSLGLGAALVYWINHNVGVVGSFDYIFANTKEDVVPDDVGIFFYSINIGARVTTRNREGLQPFGELTVGRVAAPRSLACQREPRELSDDLGMEQKRPFPGFHSTSTSPSPAVTRSVDPTARAGRCATG